ncbi:MAG: OsmC family protein [Acidobacteria bacterium]|nr:OsmC family protein [Acidobacteriota bacterium]
MEAQISWRTDMVFEGTNATHPLVMDGNRKLGQSPMQLVLYALGGCTSVDVVEILKKRRKTIEKLDIRMTGQRRQEKYPRIFENIHMHFDLTSPDARDSDMEKAIALSLGTYCSVAGMLTAVNITTSFSITVPS